MVRCLWLPMMLTLLLGPARGNAEDTYAIKLKESGTGDRSQVDKESTEKTSMKIEDGQGNTLQSKNETKTQKFIYQETILEKPAGQPKATRLKRHYDVAEVKTGDDNQTLAYQGKTVVIEKRGDTYHFQVEGGEELTGKDTEHLEKEFNKRKGDELDFNKILVPKKPVQVKESWKLEADALIKDLEKESPLQFDTTGAKATATLLKAYKQDGRQFGVVAIHLDFPIKAIKMGDMAAPLGKSAKLVVDGTVDGCIDGSLSNSTANGKVRMEGKGELAQGDMKFKLTFSVNATTKGSEKEVAKK